LIAELSCFSSPENVSWAGFTSAGIEAILELEMLCILATIPSREVSYMSVMVEFSVVPLGKGASLSAVVAKVLWIVAKSGVRYKANPMGTVLEGSWEEVMGVIKKCHDEVMKDSERAVTSITIDDRKGQDARIEKKLESVELKLGMKLDR
jgi:uncharacterized protein (TIGR00106 family)